MDSPKRVISVTDGRTAFQLYMYNIYIYIRQIDNSELSSSEHSFLVLKLATILKFSATTPLVSILGILWLVVARVYTAILQTLGFSDLKFNTCI